MINNPFGIIVFLIAIEVCVLWLASQPRFKKYFKFLPSVFWIYFIPMLAATFGVLDSGNPIYSKITKTLLPACLFLLLLCVDVKAILRLGPKALGMMLAGSFGIVLGTGVVFALFKGTVGDQMWSGFGALSASWMGGSANMVAVKEALGTPDEVFTPMVVVDTIVPYFWMGLLVSAAAWQSTVDRWHKADSEVLKELNDKLKMHQSEESFSWNPTLIGVILCVALAGGFAAKAIGGWLPEIKGVVSTYAWTIILASVLGLSCSFTKVRQLQSYGSEKIGYWILYFVLTSIGAKASLQDAGSAVTLLAAGFLIVLIHGIILLLAARLMRAPMFLAAVASQANLGGVASAPIVAEVYHPGLASVGLLMAVFGGIAGTYFGLIAGQICRMIAGGG